MVACCTHVLEPYLEANVLEHEKASNPEGDSHNRIGLQVNRKMLEREKYADYVVDNLGGDPAQARYCKTCPAYDARACG